MPENAQLYLQQHAVPGRIHLILCTEARGVYVFDVSMHQLVAKLGLSQLAGRSPTLSANWTR